MKSPIDFESVDARDQWIEDNADYFTVVRHEGLGKYERHEVPTKDAAMSKAAELAAKRDKVYMVYAVAGIGSAFIDLVKPAQWR